MDAAFNNGRQRLLPADHCQASALGGHMAVGRGPRVCSLCDEAVGRRHDLTEVAVGAALDTQAKIEMVRGSAAQQLRRAGGIGALLRY